jgi:hypothetical protein
MKLEFDRHGDEFFHGGLGGQDLFEPLDRSPTPIRIDDNVRRNSSDKEEY